MSKVSHIDYETYKEIMEDLLSPIEPKDLDSITIKKLYESKLIYLENLRQKCFIEINTTTNSLFTESDYQLILEAIKQTKKYLKQEIINTINQKLSKYKAIS